MLTFLITAGIALPAGCGRTPAASAGERLPPGPWGQLTARPLLLAPPLEVIDRVDLADAPAAWRLRGLTSDDTAALLAGLGLPDDRYEQLLATLRPRPDGDGYTVSPSAEVVTALSPDARARLYHRLAQDPLNRPQMNAFRYCGPSADAWLAGWGLSPETRALVEPLIYRNGDVLFFADAAAVFPRVTDTDERKRLIQALAAETSLQLTLHVPEDADVEALAAYWGGPAARTDLRTLLRSLAGRPGGGSIDVAHLLPPFARMRLYHYPQGDTLLEGGASRDCHWTALNFATDTPDDRYADADAVAAALQTEYEPVAEPRFGDLVVFRSGGEIYHSAVYLAADILFTRNGTRFSRPWMLIHLGQMRDFYPRAEPIETVFMRRRMPG